jgi:hypothetical protein
MPREETDEEERFAWSIPLYSELVSVLRVSNWLHENRYPRIPYTRIGCTKPGIPEFRILESAARNQVSLNSV